MQHHIKRVNATMRGRAALAALAILCLAVTAQAQPVVLYLAPDGNDAWSGRAPEPVGEEGPFATLERARDEIRALKERGEFPVAGAVVQLAAGTYERHEAFELEAQDSGTATGRIEYRAAPGAEVRIVGGTVLTGFEPVTDPEILRRLDEAARGNVLQTNVREQGVEEYGALSGGFGQPSGHPAELFFNDEPMTLARWPNEGFVNIVEMVSEPTRDGRGRVTFREGKFRYEGDRPERWVEEKDAWLHGYWFHDWADYRQPIESIDTEEGVITLAPPHHGYGYRPGRWYYAFNLLSELDRPGQWYLDRETDILYFWPPADIGEARVVMSSLLELVNMQDVSHVSLRGLILENNRGNAVRVSGGSEVWIAACTIRNLGGYAVSVSGGTEHLVVGCDMYGMGDGGIILSGGDRRTLTPAGHTALNNHIHHYARVNRIVRPGIRLSGVGNRAAHNLIHNAPHQAISFGGNEHIMEFNEIHSVCYESNDAGAIYAGRDWTMRGHVIRHNHFHNISGLGGRGCVGVYLDDAFGGTDIYGNLFYRVTRAAMVGGGRDCSIENNIFVECVPAIHIDNRGVGWASDLIVPGGGWRMYEKLEAVNYDQPPYSERYPELARILDEHPHEPHGNVVMANIIVGGEPWSLRHNPEHNVIENNLVGEDPLFVDRENLDFRLREGSPAFDLGFRRLPFDRMGLYEDALRASWPVEHEVRTKVIEGRVERPRRTGPPPVFEVTRTQADITIDGNIREDEWGGRDAAMLIEQGIYGEKTSPPSHAWLVHDGEALLVAVDNQTPDLAEMALGDEWGKHEAVELAIRNPASGDPGPIIVLRGFATGHFESSDEAGAPEDVVSKAAEGVQYAARILGPHRWSAEWRIPFASLGVDPRRDTRLQFNLSVRKTATGLWQMWEGSHAHTWRVDNTGFLELKD